MGGVHNGRPPLRCGQATTPLRAGRHSAAGMPALPARIRRVPPPPSGGRVGSSWAGFADGLPSAPCRPALRSVVACPPLRVGRPLCTFVTVDDYICNQMITIVI